MDLNKLYSQHQVALMNAGAAASASIRMRYLDHAAQIAEQIGAFQRTNGAEACKAWEIERQPRLLPVRPVGQAKGAQL